MTTRSKPKVIPAGTPYREAVAEMLEEERRPSFVERIASARAKRRVSTPSKALAQIEKLETEGVVEVGEPVYVWPATRGRVTGHAVACEGHGMMPVLAPSKRAGVLAAARHIKSEHRGAGTVVLRDRAPRIRVAS